MGLANLLEQKRETLRFLGVFENLDQYLHDI